MFACQRHLTNFYNPLLHAGRVTLALGFSPSSAFPPFYRGIHKKHVFEHFGFKVAVLPAPLVELWFGFHPILYLSLSFFFLMEREIFQFMFCLLDKVSRLFFKYLKREIHQVTFGKIDLNNSFLQNVVNPWSMENVRTQWMSLNTILPQDTVKNCQSLPSCFHCELTGLGVSMPILAQASQKWNSILHSGFSACLAQPEDSPAPGWCHRALGGPRAPLPQCCSHHPLEGTSPSQAEPWQWSKLGTKSPQVGNRR